MKQISARIATVFGIVWLLLLSAGTAMAAATPAEVKDMAGRTVRIQPVAKRIIPTFKPSSLCVAALGLQNRLVGIDTDSQKDILQLAVYPPVADLPVVGRKSTGLNFEAMVALQPDLVIMYAQKDGIAIADRLADHGIAAIVILPESLESLYATMRLIATAAGVPQRAQISIAACQRLIDLTRQRVAEIKEKERKTVYFASTRGFFSTATGDLLQDEIITTAGAIHTGHALSGYFREISPEKFLQWNPDVVVVSGGGMPKATKMLARPQYARVSAVEAGRIHAFPSNIAPWDFPSPLSAAGVLWMASRCYPQRFADVNVAEEIDAFHKVLFGKTFKELGGRLSR